MLRKHYKNSFIRSVFSRNFSQTNVTFAVGSKKRTPPPLKHKLPPPPPLRGPSTSVPSQTGGGKSSPQTRSPQEVLSIFVEYIPTYFTPIQCIAAILPEEEREQHMGRGRFLNFLRKFPFLFEIRQTDMVRCDVRLRSDVSHPSRGAADEKFMMADVGELTSYVAKPEFITSTESIEQGSQVVHITPPSPPPALRVRLEERVPVMDRLQSLVPETFSDIDELEEHIPEDVLFHPYFDCQGGLRAIGHKFPDYFQVVENRIRRRPTHLAPLALDELTLAESPLPEVAALVRAAVCDNDIPHWVSVTSLYEQLTVPQKREIKKGFKSFSGFLRVHGRELSVSNDLLQVSMWARNPQEGSGAAKEAAGAVEKGESNVSQQGMSETAKDSVGAQAVKDPDERKKPIDTVIRFNKEDHTMLPTLTHVQVLNEMFDRFPPQKSLPLSEAIALLPEKMQSIPATTIAGWLISNPSYFTVESSSGKDAAHIVLRRASDRQPLDLISLIYKAFDTKKKSMPTNELLESPLLSSEERELLRRFSIPAIVSLAPEWLQFADDTSSEVLCLRSLEELNEVVDQEALPRKETAQAEKDKQRRLAKKESTYNANPLKFDDDLSGL